MDLTTKDRVRLFLAQSGISSDSANDAQLSALITGISNRVKRILRREVQSTSRTVYHDVYQGMKSVQLFGYPISSITSIHNSLEQTWDSSTILTTLDDYNFNADTGIVYFRYQDLDHGPQALRIVYTGGMAASTSAFITAFPDIELAVIQQVVEEYRRSKKSLGANSVSVDGDSVSFIGDTQLLPLVREALQPHICYGVTV